MIEYFNCHSRNWGHTETVSNRHNLDDSIKRNKMALTHDHEFSQFFNSKW